MRSHYGGIEGSNILSQSLQTERDSCFQGNPFWCAGSMLCGWCQDPSWTSEEKAETWVLSEPLLACAAFVCKSTLSAYTVGATLAQEQMTFTSWTEICTT